MQPFLPVLELVPAENMLPAIINLGPAAGLPVLEMLFPDAALSCIFGFSGLSHDASFMNCNFRRIMA